MISNTHLQPDGPVIAKLIFIHGFSDHVGRYYGFFPSLAARGIAVHGLDQRGWGRSVRKPAERGLTGPTTQVLADMAVQDPAAFGKLVALTGKATATATA